jgi:small subunit ribosomal protein S13
MPRVIGVYIPDNKRLIISLTYIYGIGKFLSAQIIKELGLSEDMKAGELTEDDIAKIAALLESRYTVEGNKRREVQNDIQRLISIHSYRGLRHRLRLPVRGQRTRVNARTRKGKKRTIAGKKKAPAKK